MWHDLESTEVNGWYRLSMDILVSLCALLATVYAVVIVYLFLFSTALSLVMLCSNSIVLLV